MNHPVHLLPHDGTDQRILFQAWHQLEDMISVNRGLDVPATVDMHGFKVLRKGAVSADEGATLV